MGARKDMAETKFPLSGIVVLDLTRVRSGPTAVRQLADYGADVIKIEEPDAKDSENSAFDRRLGSDFQNLQRNKRSMTLNLKAPEGLAIFKRLVDKADVVVETPGGQLKVAEVARDAFVGEIGILCDVPRTATIIATENLTTLKITKDLFFRMITDFPTISIEVMRVLAQRLEHTTEQLRDAVAATKH